MKKRLFKYRWLNTIVVVFNLCVLLIFGFGTFDTYNFFKSETNTISAGKFFALGILIVGFLLSCISLILVSLKLPKSLFFLTIFYGFLIVIFLVLLATMFLQEFSKIREDISSSEYGILFGSICITTLLVIMINKYKYEEVKFDNIEFIGQNEE